MITSGRAGARLDRGRELGVLVVALTGVRPADLHVVVGLVELVHDRLEGRVPGPDRDLLAPGFLMVLVQPPSPPPAALLPLALGSPDAPLVDPPPEHAVNAPNAMIPAAAVSTSLRRPRTHPTHPNPPRSVFQGHHTPLSLRRHSPDRSRRRQYNVVYNDVVPRDDTSRGCTSQKGHDAGEDTSDAAPPGPTRPPTGRGIDGRCSADEPHGSSARSCLGSTTTPSRSGSVEPRTRIEKSA